MGIPVVQTYRIARYILEQKLKGNKRYPLVLMLEPLFQCNLACSGCGKIDYPDEILRKRMSVEDALRAVGLDVLVEAGVHRPLGGESFAKAE
jgi:MoaA/NifB/PqqE/SkfB family radical SAM enzyme